MASRLVRVVDGDTVVVKRFGLFGHYTESIRLSAIDAPELNQPGGVRSANALRAFLSRAMPQGVVYVTTRGVDRYGRTIGDIAIRRYCPTLINPFRVCLVDAASFMIRNGYAWAIPAYGAGPTLVTLWRSARRRRVGIWRGRRPVRPSTWRRSRRRKPRVRSKLTDQTQDLVNLVQSIF